MAKKRTRRARKTLPSTLFKEPVIAQGTHLDRVDGMTPPNHLMPHDGKKRLMRLLRKDDALGNVGAFIDPVHGQFHWHLWEDHPPTFCDPLVLEQACRNDSKIQGIIRDALSGKIDPEKAKKALIIEIERVFDNEVLPRIYELLTHAQPGIAEYLLARSAWVHHEEVE